MGRREGVMGSPPVEGWREFPPSDMPPILRSALDAFTAKGYHATSMRDIASGVGVTVPAIYYHYENKQELLVTLLETGVEEVLQRTELALAEAHPDRPDEQLSLATEAVALFEAYRGGLAFLDSEIRSLEPDNRVWYVNRRHSLQETFVSILAAGRQQGAFVHDDTRTCARAIPAMCQGIATWYRPGGITPPDELARQYAGFALGTARQGCAADVRPAP